ncbi:MAG TPA: lysylphosphatidylglycerol synthase transmembrane domain-containing protein [Anaerolineales bacterium]|nr:lysylphosphatidylglycerol synthase transmembrane domain-containing protein [Anaerolineales bacterium]
MKDIKRWLPGVLISIILIAAILSFVDLPKMVAAIRSADYRILAVALFFAFAWLYVRAVVWRTLLRERAPYWEVFHSLNIGYLLNAFLPFRLGELGRAYVLSLKSDMKFVEILPTIVIERSMDLAITAAIFLSSLPFVVGAKGADSIAIALGVLVVLGLLFLFILAKNDQWALDMFHRLSARWPSIQRFGGSILESFLTGLGVLTDGWLFARFMFWILLNWAMSIATFYLALHAFFPQAQWVWAFFGLGAGAAGNAVPSAPGAVGTYEGALGGALTLLSGDRSTSLAVALTSHLFNYLTAIILGGYALIRDGQSLSGIYRQLIAFRTKASKDDPAL